MKKSAIVLFFAAFLSATVFAQNVQEGVNNFYAERYGSAKSVFEKLTAANPNNIEAIYWLGQTYIAMDNVAGAKGLYDKTLAANGNAPLVTVARGQIDLLEGKAAEGRQRFEAAITASRGKKGADPAILNAIGRANTTTYSDNKKLGDIDYAISKLNEAAQIAPTNPEIFYNLGDAYRKKHNGSDAVQAYRKAVNFAPAIYRVAMLYQTQTQYGQGNWDVVLENLNNAVLADPKYAPAFLELYYYNLLYKKDFSSAENFANKYLSSADQSVDNDYLKAQTDFVQQKYDDAITIGKNIISQTNNNPKARVYRLLAYSYLGIKDTATACQYSDQFFGKAKEDDIVAKDYILHAQSCGRNNPDFVRSDVIKAVESETEMANKVAMLNEFIRSAKESGLRGLEGELQLVSYNLRGNKSNPNELITNIAVPFYFGGNFKTADSVSQAYSSLQPDSIYGWYWSALALSAIDTSTTTSEGLAMPAYEKVLTIAEKDVQRFKTQGVRSATALAIYYFNFKNDKTSALSYANRGLAFDPENANLLNIQKLLQKPAKQPAPPKKTTPRKKGTKK